MKNIIQKTKSYGAYFIALYIVLQFSGNVIAQVTGTVYRDIPANGATANTYGVKDGNELGVEGVTVTVYPGGVTATTASDGTYSIAGVNGAVRIEFSNWPNYLKESSDGGGVNSSIQFVIAPVGNVDFGLHNPGDYSELNPSLVTPKLLNGDPLAAGSNLADDPALYLFPNTSTGDAQNGGTALTTIATQSQIGSTYGIAYSKKLRKLFLSSIYKRHAPLGPGETGGRIFYIDNPNSAPTGPAKYVDLVSDLGINVGTIESNSARGLEPDKNTATHDDNTFSSAGKVGLGDLDISEDGKFLFVVNLFDRKVYKIDIENVNTGNPNATALPDFTDPNCTGGIARPFGLGVHDGELYLGIVCTAENSGNDADLHVYIQKFNFSSNTWGDVIDFVPDWPKGVIYSEGNDGLKWQAWENDYNNFDDSHSHPQPIVGDLEFDSEGSMHIVILDRVGEQLGHRNYIPNSNSIVTGITGGELLRTYKDPVTGVFSLESNAAVGPYTSGGTGTNPKGQGGPNTNQGPGGGEFYADDFTGGYHNETTNGGLALIKGSKILTSVQMDPIDNSADASGILWWDRNTGLEQQEYQIFHNSSNPSPDFSKQNGLGDLEYLSAPAPIEIGNLVWLDADGDGVQDPDESGIEGVVIKLFQGANELASATTDANGHYVFSNDPNGTTTASHIYNISQLVDGGVDYMLIIEDVDGASKQTPLTDYLPTDTKTGEGSNNKSNDSNGALNGTRSEETIASQDIEGVGNNNHSYDFGFEPMVNCDNTPNMICDDATTSYTLTAEAGLTNVVWYNSSDAQVGTGNTLVVDSNTSGMDDGNDSYYYKATDGNGCPIELCCPVYFETEVCCSMDETHLTECNDNGTPADETDDYFNLTVTGNLTGGSGNYVVKIGTYTSASTASGTAITIIGDGTDTNLASDGASTYTVKVEDSVNSSCFAEFTVGPIDECSECPAPDCLMIQVKKKN